MRLLNTNTLQFKEFFDNSARPFYAILSHTWGSEEVTFQEMLSRPPGLEDKDGFQKIRRFCEVAKSHGFEWCWVDTCCINKTSSAELSEAINSMFAWYRDSTICYVYLEDMPPADLIPELPVDWNDNEKRPSVSLSGAALLRLGKCRWFTRGWTLQELLAPPMVMFCANDWSLVGTKTQLSGVLSDITGIPQSAIHGEDLKNFTVAEKMSWAAPRTTTKPEDEAYCLLGIFDVNIPLIYGEGYRAFYRLQEEILKQSEDLSLLLWMDTGIFPDHWYSIWQSSERPRLIYPTPVLARRPNAFIHSRPSHLYSSLKQTSFSTAFQKRTNLLEFSNSLQPAHMTSRGIRVQLPIFRVDNPLSTYGEKEVTFLWTGFMRDNAYVCLPLIHQDSPGQAVYLRLFDYSHSLHFFLEDDVHDVEIKEMFLQTSYTAWHDVERHFYPNPICAPQRLNSLVLIISTPHKPASRIQISSQEIKLKLLGHESRAHSAILTRYDSELFLVHQVPKSGIVLTVDIELASLFNNEVCVQPRKSTVFVHLLPESKGRDSELAMKPKITHPDSLYDITTSDLDDTAYITGDQFFDVTIGAEITAKMDNVLSCGSFIQLSCHFLRILISPLGCVHDTSHAEHYMLESYRAINSSVKTRNYRRL